MKDLLMDWSSFTGRSWKYSVASFFDWNPTAFFELFLEILNYLSSFSFSVQMSFHSWISEFNESIAIFAL